jgi:hypothetical protein
MEDVTPPTQPSGDLNPPPRVPPSGVALAAPSPAPLDQSRSIDIEGTALGRFVDRTLDVVDGVADTLAELLRIRGAA